MMHGRLGRLCVALCCAAAFCLFLGTSMADSAIQMECDIGYGGTVTYLRQLPISVRLVNGGEDASGTLSVSVNRGNGQYDCYDMPVTVAAGATVRVSIPVLLTTKQSAYHIQWLVNGQAVAQQEIKPQRVIDPSSLIVGVLSEDAQSLSHLAITKSADPLKRGESWQTVSLKPESFPEQLDGLRFFDLLAVDGVDLNALNEKQQNALDQWLQKGGVALVGGGSQAATAFPYFARYSGISAGALSDGGDVTEKIMKQFRMSEAPLGQSVMTVKLENASGEAPEEAPLWDVTRVGSGYVITAAFSLSDKPLSTWQGKNVLWQRVLLQYAQSRYQDMLLLRSGEGGSYTAGRYMDSSITGSIGVPNGPGMALPMILLAMFVLLAGFGSYLLLRKLDRREWMWAAVPALAVVCSLVMWALSGALNLQKPIAVSYTVLNIDKAGADDSYTVVAAAQAETGRMAIGTREGTMDLSASVGYSYSAETEEEGGNLRYRYTYGAPDTLSFPETKSWDANLLMLRDVLPSSVALSGQCTWNGDNLEFVIENKSELAFDKGVVITDYGYVSVPELLPGQSAKAVMTPAKQGKAVRSSEDIEDGLLLGEQERVNFSYYDYIQAFTKVDKTLPAEEKNKLVVKRSLMNNNTGGSNWNSGNCFHYVTFCDGLASPSLLIGGLDVVRTASINMVDVELTFNPISTDGKVRFLKGSFPVYAAEKNDAGLPTLGEALGSNRYLYFNLNLNPIFAFDVSAAPEKWTLTGFDLSPSYAYYAYEVLLYNHRTGAWDAFKTWEIDQSTGVGTAKMTLPKLSDYVDDGHMIYAQFQKHGKEDQYAEIGVPVLTMDGGLK